MSNREGSISSPRQDTRTAGSTGAPHPANPPVEPPFGKVSLVVALGVLTIFAWVSWTMLGIAADASDSDWSRKLVIFNSLQSLAFGAAGLLFGNRLEHVHTQAARGAANAANDRVVEARETAAIAVQKGLHLRWGIETLSGSAAESIHPDAPLQRLRVEAARLFPD